VKAVEAQVAKLLAWGGLGEPIVEMIRIAQDVEESTGNLDGHL